ncbi:hypothetical protein JX265_007482 [Neoarthrinium moseri]|uniref:Survival protein SurE-like phosphatase/nucleotidase domain-containing protein n=1 Tax=Neoarthrinium moseri TaxID=1658444 RepID=A0A9P9WJI2_9PEZI|nr:uncharacterized protein JN550_000103 [Neoarthrinium moseri]KAI1854650.1 hypothetical protein JX266_000768 [Neoarthrinium moseri]KAI1866906.1 hypothetical protein JX265_007482 [Neoarthrinium moseri]KAI1877921.1 hypothetical protein JN550_000103 [Neoarthrinium moseri]
MRPQIALLTLSLLIAHGYRILQTNEDGWAALYLRSLFNALKASGHDLVLVAPAENKTGSGSRDEQPRTRLESCHFNSCTVSPQVPETFGENKTQQRLYWVNSFPITSLRVAVTRIVENFWFGKRADLVISGPHSGTTLGSQVLSSGTIGAAAYAAEALFLPALAFSGASEADLPWNTTAIPESSVVYTELAEFLTSRVLDIGEPYLPDNTFLNVNFPKIESKCRDPEDFEWILSRINSIAIEPDVRHCNKNRLPTEAEVISKGGCRISVSLGEGTTKLTAPGWKQIQLRDNLESLWSCL